MEVLKNNSLVNKAIFPAPNPSYDLNTYPGGELFFLEGSNGKFPCIFSRVPYSRGIMIYLHGNGEDIGYSYDTMFEVALAAQFSLFLVEYPGYGLAGGSANENSVNEHAQIALDFCFKKLGCHPNAGENRPLIGVFGRSIGTGPSTLLASKNYLDFLILQSPYLSIKSLAKSLVGKLAWFISDRFDNKKEIENVSCPTLFIHGDRDELIPYQHSELLYQKCAAEKKKISLAEGADHNAFKLKPHVINPVVHFLDEVIPAGKLNAGDQIVIPEEYFVPPEQVNNEKWKITQVIQGSLQFSSSLIEASCATVSSDSSIRADAEHLPKEI